MVNGLTANNIKEGTVTFWLDVGLAYSYLGFYILFRNQTPYATSTPSISNVSSNGYTVAYGWGIDHVWRLNNSIEEIATGNATAGWGWRKHRLTWWEITGGLRIKLQELVSEQWVTIIAFTDPLNLYSSAAQNRIGVQFRVYYSASSQQGNVDEITIYKRRGT